MRNQFTPGPWVTKWSTRIAPGYEKGWFVSDEREQLFLIDIPDGQDAEANARLIAAAPELLEALQMIVEEYQSVLEKYNKLIAPEFMDYQTLSEAVAIIAKATGEKEEVK